MSSSTRASASAFAGASSERLVAGLGELGIAHGGRRRRRRAARRLARRRFLLSVEEARDLVLHGRRQAGPLEAESIGKPHGLPFPALEETVEPDDGSALVPRMALGRRHVAQPHQLAARARPGVVGNRLEVTAPQRIRDGGRRAQRQHVVRLVAEARQRRVPHRRGEADARILDDDEAAVAVLLAQHFGRPGDMVAEAGSRKPVVGEIDRAVEVGACRGQHPVVVGDDLLGLPMPLGIAFVGRNQPLRQGRAEQREGAGDGGRAAAMHAAYDERDAGILGLLRGSIGHPLHQLHGPPCRRRLPAAPNDGRSAYSGEMAVRQLGRGGHARRRAFPRQHGLFHQMPRQQGACKDRQGGHQRNRIEAMPM